MNSYCVCRITKANRTDRTNKTDCRRSGVAFPKAANQLRTTLFAVHRASLLCEHHTKREAPHTRDSRRILLVRVVLARGVFYQNYLALCVYLCDRVWCVCMCLYTFRRAACWIHLCLHATIKYTQYRGTSPCTLSLAYIYTLYT